MFNASSVVREDQMSDQKEKILKNFCLAFSANETLGVEDWRATYNNCSLLHNKIAFSPPSLLLFLENSTVVATDISTRLCVNRVFK